MKICVGNDRWGKQLFEGDICKYMFTDSETAITSEYKGMIIYDPSEYAFMFEQTDDSFPLLLMNRVNGGTIDKIISATGIDKDFPEYEKWIEIYNSNLGRLLGNQMRFSSGKNSFLS